MSIESNIRAYAKRAYAKHCAERQPEPEPAQGHTPGPPEPSVYSHELAAVIEQRDDLLAAVKETWCASTSDDHYIGDGSQEANRCPVCAKARAAIAKATNET